MAVNPFESAGHLGCQAPAAGLQQAPTPEDLQQLAEAKERFLNLRKQAEQSKAAIADLTKTLRARLMQNQVLAEQREGLCKMLIGCVPECASSSRSAQLLARFKQLEAAMQVNMGLPMHPEQPPEQELNQPQPERVPQLQPQQRKQPLQPMQQPPRAAAGQLRAQPLPVVGPEPQLQLQSQPQRAVAAQPRDLEAMALRHAPLATAPAPQRQPQPQSALLQAPPRFHRSSAAHQTASHRQANNAEQHGKMSPQDFLEAHLGKYCANLSVPQDRALTKPAVDMQSALFTAHAVMFANRSPAAAVDGMKPFMDNAATQGHSLGTKRPLRALAPGTTTLTVRNVPARYTLEALLSEWAPDGTFDLVDLPYNLKTKRTRGFAFVNCVSHEAALAFQQKWHGKFLADHGRTRALDVAPAELQGYEAHLLRVAGMKPLWEGDLARLPATFRGTWRLDTIAELERLANSAGCSGNGDQKCIPSVAVVSVA